MAYESITRTTSLNDFMVQSVVNLSLLESIDPSIYFDTYSFCISIPNPILITLECPFGLFF